jgi:hypothetical protein
VDQRGSEAKDSDGDVITHRSDRVMRNGGETNSDIDFGFYRIACDAHRHKEHNGFNGHDYSGDHKDDQREAGPAHHLLIDWTCEPAKPRQRHEVKLHPSFSWVNAFVCDVETRDPNQGIPIALLPAKDQNFAPARGRKR